MFVTCKPLGLEVAKDGLDEGKNDIEMSTWLGLIN
jgi:hypothetical protein